MNTGRIVNGFIVVAVGLVLLLNQQGVIDWSVWSYLIQFWPVLLIIWGIQLIFDKSWLSLGLSLLLIIGVLVISFVLWNNDPYAADNGASIVRQEEIPLDAGLEQAKLKLDYGAGQLKILDGPGGKLTLDYNYPKPKLDLQAEGKTAEYHIMPEAGTWPRFGPNRVGGEWVLRLPNGVLWDLELNVGAIKSELDLRKIDLNYLDLNAGAGNFTIRLGDRGLHTKMKINAGATNIKVYVPETVNLHFSLEGALNDHNLDAAGLVRMGDYYVYTADSRSSSTLELEVSGAANRMELVRVP